jgi:hypothetical protein
VRFGRFFVTSVILLAMAAATACDRKRSEREHSGQKNQEQKNALVKEGNDNIAKAEALKKQLAADYNVTINSDSVGLHTQSQQTKDLNDNLMNRPLAARQDIQGRLAQYLQLINRVIEIDSKNLMNVANRDVLYTSRNSAELLQKSVEQFVKAHGENFNPPPAKDAPPAPANNRADSTSEDDEFAI